VLEHAAINDSLVEHPAMLGGARPGDRPLDVDPDTLLPTTLDRPLGPIRRLIISTDGNHEYGEVIDVRTAQVDFSGQLTELDHGGIRLDSLEEGGGFHEYLGDGDLFRQGLGVTGHDGTDLGAVVIDHTAGLADFHPVGGGAPQFAMHFDALNHGAFRIIEPQGGRAWTFDAHGGLTHAPIQLTNHLGEHLVDVEVDFAEGAAYTADPGLAHVLNPGGDHDWSYRPANDGSGDFRLANPGPHGNTWRDFDADGRLVGEGFPLLHMDGHPIANADFQFRGAPETHTAIFTAPGREPGEHFVTVNSAGSYRVTWDDGSVLGIVPRGTHGELTAADLRATLPTGDDLGSVRVYYGAGNGTAGFHAPGVLNRNWTFTHDAQHSGYTLTDDADLHTLHFNGDNELTLHEIQPHEPVTGNDLNPIGVDHGNELADFHAPGLANQQWRFDHVGADGDGFTLSNLGSTHTFHFDGDNALTGHDIQTRDPGTGHQLNPVHVDHGNGVADFHAPGLHDQQWAFNPGPHDGSGFSLSDLGQTHTFHFDGNNELAGHDIRPHDPATGHDLNPIHVDQRTGLADFHAPGLPNQQWHFDHVGGDGDGFTLTSADTMRTLHFDANGNLNFERLSTRNPATGLPSGNFIHIEHVGGTDSGLVHTLVGGDGRAVPDFRVTLTDDGHYLVTDTHTGWANGSFTEFDSVTTAVRNERVNLQDDSGLHIDVDHLHGAPTAGPHPLDVTGVGDARFTVTRDAGTGRIELTDTSLSHAGDTRTFNPAGGKIGEHISITDVKGRPTGDHITVDLSPGTARWTRTNTTAADDRLGTAYNASGAVKIKKDGTLVLEGADKTPFFLREKLTTGQSLELTRLNNGGRRWTTWDQDGNFTGKGIRQFGNEDGGARSWDVGSWGATIRQYRTAIDGGSVRAEKLPDGSFAWTRFDKDGLKTLSGVRNHSLGGMLGWKDVYEVGGRTFEVQRSWSAFNFFSHASHYQEFGISADARAADGFVTKDSFKEVSQQGKDTGSLEVLGNGNKLQFTRYAEQRPPDFLWKSPDNLPNGMSKVLAKTYMGSKYGAIDFPHQGFVFGDSRFQVFKWSERDAHDAQVSGGVRVLTPDGSFSDFAGDGVFVRGAIKLDNGNTVEIGRAADGKWDTFRLDGDGSRPAPTLNWRELNSKKELVGSGFRTFNGKQWRDVFTDDAGVVHVVRHTNGDGDVVHFSGTTKPQLNTRALYEDQIVHANAGSTSHFSITRNTMGQIVERTDHWGDPDGGGRNVTASGDPRSGNWTWRDQHGVTGIRINGRNTPGNGSWDDSFADFRLDPRTGLNTQIRDFHALDKGTSLKAEPTPGGGGRSWTSAKFDAKGDQIPGTEAIRTWKQGNTFHDLPRGFRNPKLTLWQDHDVDGNLLRELTADNKVREYTDAANGMHAWKEYNFGSVWRERQPLSGNPNLFKESESFQKQWRVTAADGTLLRYRSITGRVYELNSLGKWRLAGTEVEDKGLLNDIRGNNRQIREPNRFHYRNIDGEVGEFRGSFSKIAQKTFADVLQDFLIDVTANIIITGATDGWDFKSNQIGSFFAGAAIRSGFKGAYGILSETALKGFRDGLRNMDGGKDFNRQPYNNDKWWDNEWAGNENPTRWRSGAFDFFVGSTFVPAIGSFIATIATGSTFGFGKDGITLSGDDLMKAAGLGLAGNLVGGLSVGAIKTLGHLTFSGRWFHTGGIPDITLTFGEKLLTDWFVNDFLGTVTPLSAGHEAKILTGTQAEQNQGGAQG
jgi:hypothetical protein